MILFCKPNHKLDNFTQHSSIKNYVNQCPVTVNKKKLKPLLFYTERP